MQKLLALAAVALCALPLLSYADDAPRSNSDCAELLERWAGDPKAAPRSVINACKDQLAASPSGEPLASDKPGASGDPGADRRAKPAAATAAAANLDPCSGPDAANSVLCWGPWATLAPAAAAPLAALELPESPVDCDAIAGLASQCVPKLEPVLAIEGCAPGTPCGFATIVPGFTSDGDPGDTEFGRFDLAPDGTRFRVSPGSGGNIDSVPMTTVVTPPVDGYDNLFSTGSQDGVNSRVTARVKQDDEGQVLLAADIWTHGTRGNARSGYFAWGTATSQAGLNALNAGKVVVNFTGPMSVNNATTGTMTVKFGASPTWTGTWTNPVWTFGAGGAVSGANLISQPSQFTDNVTGSGNFVQGALVGEAGGPRGITHIIDVTLEGQGRIKDVGLLRDVVTTPGIDP